MRFGGRRLHAIARRRGMCRFAVALLVFALAVGASSAFGATGDLTETACVDFDSFHGCTNLQPEFDYANDIVPTSDGLDVYVLRNGMIEDVFPTEDGGAFLGQCWQLIAEDGCDSLSMLAGYTEQMVISPDGAFAYVAESMQLTIPSDLSVVAMRRDAATGTLSDLQCLGRRATTNCPTPGSTHLPGAVAIAITPDGRYVDAAGSEYGHTAFVSTFARASDGTLSEIGCLASLPTDGCETAPAISYPRAIGESADGSHVYVGGNDAVVSLARGADGALHEIGCVAGTTFADPLCDRLSTFDHPVQYFTLAPDGRFAYVMTDGTGLGAWGMRVDADGVLRDAGCTWAATPFLTPCGPGAGQYLGPVSISPDGYDMYTASGGKAALRRDGTTLGGLSQDDAGGLSAATDTAVYYYRKSALHVFQRETEQAPTCTAPASTLLGPVGVLRISCADPNNDPLQLVIDRAPAHGSIASIATGTDGVATIMYVESPGTAARDSFTFHADDGFRTSAVGTDAFELIPSLAVQTPLVTTTGSHRTRVSVSFGKASIVRLLRHAATVAFRCAQRACRGTVELRRSRTLLAHGRFAAANGGAVHVVLRLPHAFSVKARKRVPITLRVHASAPGHDPATFQRILYLASGPGAR